MKKDTATTSLEYNNKIVYLRLKEGADITIEALNEQFEAQKQLVGNDTYAVLVDGTKNVNITKESRRYMAEYNWPNRKATAIISKNNLATVIIANFYINFNKPKIPTKLFKKENDAVDWLKNHL